MRERGVLSGGQYFCKSRRYDGRGRRVFAGVLSAISDGEKNWNTILRKGNVCGALATQRKGAIDSFPTKDKVGQVMRNGLR